MRIIGGALKGRVIGVNKKLPVRPTTDFAREGLFNVLENQIDFEDISLLDLFAGTGMISLEFLSRGAKNALAIDNHPNCVTHIRQLASTFQVSLEAQKRNVFQFLKNTDLSFNFIFADPPYHLSNIDEISTLVFQNNSLLMPNGILVVEHSKHTQLANSANFVETRKYGNVNFSFFKHNA